jgi:hypothetical protein
MGILLGFTPFVAFALAANLWGAMAGLMIGAAVSATLLVKDLIRRQQPKILEIGTFLMFAGLLAWVKLFPSPLTVLTVRLRVDVGLLMIIVISMAIAKPFTLQYARERVPEERWKSPQFAKINFVITGVWALAFVYIVAARLVPEAGSATLAISAANRHRALDRAARSFATRQTKPARTAVAR